MCFIWPDCGVKLIPSSGPTVLVSDAGTSLVITPLETGRNDAFGCRSVCQEQALRASAPLSLFCQNIHKRHDEINLGIV